MSKITVDAVEPSTGTSLTLGASGDTITVPSGATLTNNGTMTNSGTATGFGKVLQYAYTEGYSGSISVDNNTTPASAGASFLVSITPTLSTSRILIEVGSAMGGTQNQTYKGLAKLYRQIGGGGYSSINTQSLIYLLSNISHPWSTSYTDSPSTTSQVDYQLYVYTSANDVAYFAENNYFRYIRAWEIAA